MSALDVDDAAALEGALDALPQGTWVEVTTPQGERHLVVRVPGGWHLPGDAVVASGDVADGSPTRVEVLGRDDRLPPRQAVALARAEFHLARDRGDVEAAGAVVAEMDDLASVGWDEAGVLRDEAAAWLNRAQSRGWSSPVAGSTSKPGLSGGPHRDRGSGRFRG